MLKEKQEKDDTNETRECCGFNGRILCHCLPIGIYGDSSHILELGLADKSGFDQNVQIIIFLAHIQAFFGRFSAIKTKSTWQNLEFFGKMLEFF